MREQKSSAMVALRDIWPMALFALAAYVGAILGGLQTNVQGILLSWAALIMLGGAVAILVAGRVGIVAEQRLGKRAQTARRRYHMLTLGTAAVVFYVLALGIVVTRSGGLWDCLALPICLSVGQAEMVSNVHRITAALSAVLVLVVAIQTWRTRPEPLLRNLAAWALGLILAQTSIGIVQVMLAGQGGELSLGVIRLAHLAVGSLTWSALVAIGTLALRLPYPTTDRAEAGAQVGGPGITDRTLLATQPSLLKDYVSLTKPGVISLLIFTTITAMYITPAGTPALSLVLWTALGGWLMASGSHSINCYLDKEIDLNMGRTSRRPIPSGRIPAWHALVLGIVLGIVAFGILAIFVNMLAALLALAGLLYYVFIYTIWLKRRSWNNIVIGGGAGAFPPLVGWAAVTGQLSWAALILWVLIFYWTPPHFWALAIIRAKDYARAGVPMLPVVAGEQETRRQILLYSLQMVAISFLPTGVGMLGIPYLLMAVAFGGVFLYYAIRMQRDYATSTTWGLYKYSLLYLALLFVAMVVDRVAFA